MYYFYIPFALTFFLHSYVFITKMLHLYQLESYKIITAIKKYKQQIKVGDFVLYVVLLIAFYSLFYAINSFVFKVIIISVFNLLFFIYLLNFVNVKNDSKLPLKYTRRIIRFIVVFTLLYLIILFVCAFNMSAINFNSLIFLCVLTSCIMFILTHFILLPIEKLVYFYFLQKAKRKLAKRKDVIKIAITGSFGKTTTKYILLSILKQKYSVLISPNSYNTPMGLSKTILKELNNNHKVFIMEMGANKVNDIKYLCKKFKPEMGILTNIGKAHLQSFKTISNIINTKCELPNNLYGSKFMVFNAENKYIFDYAVKYKPEKIMVGKNNELYAKINKVSENGSDFEIYYKNQKYLEANTKLLGEHNINNILLCVAMAIKLGLSKQQIINGIKKIEPIKNRLELIKQDNGAIILNDSYNSNPTGCKVALNALSLFAGKKVVITPGMVELGNDQYRENYKFGKEIAKVADYVFVVNNVNKDAIVNGLFDAGFDFENVKTVSSFNKIKFCNFKKGDVVLIENDLPDNYK